MKRSAFRFAVVYLAVFCLATQISGSLLANPSFTYRGLGRLWPMRDLTHWVARTFFGVDIPLDDVSGGETLFFWIQWCWIVVASLLVTIGWSLWDRGHTTFDSWTAWFRLAIRLLLAASMLEYGMTKVIPTQFPAPPLTALVTPVGEMTLSALLWTTIGSAPAYQIATGTVEVLAGVLLLLPWTVTLGALLALVSMIQVLLLNLTFDIGVKLVTTHLIVMAVILIAPAIRLAPESTLRVRLKADTTAPNADTAPRLTTTRLATIVPIAIGVYLLGVQAWINWSFWNAQGGGRPQSLLYGIWNVEELSVDGEVRAAEANDYDRRWRRVIFDTPSEIVVQRTDDSFARYGAAIDAGAGTIALTKGGSRTWSSRFVYDRHSDEAMTLSGDIDGHTVKAELRRVDRAAFPLLNSTFRWIRPHDP